MQTSHVRINNGMRQARSCSSVRGAFPGSESLKAGSVTVCDCGALSSADPKPRIAGMQTNGW